jgi:hypothetical protein
MLSISPAYLLFSLNLPSTSFPPYPPAPPSASSPRLLSPLTPFLRTAYPLPSPNSRPYIPLTPCLIPLTPAPPPSAPVAPPPITPPSLYPPHLSFSPCSLAPPVTSFPPPFSSAPRLRPLTITASSLPRLSPLPTPQVSPTVAHSPPPIPPSLFCSPLPSFLSVVPVAIPDPVLRAMYPHFLRFCLTSLLPSVPPPLPNRLSRPRLTVLCRAPTIPFAAP